MNVFLWRKGVYEKAPDLWSCVKWVTIKRPAKKKAPRKNATKLHFCEALYQKPREETRSRCVFWRNSFGMCRG